MKPWERFQGKDKKPWELYKLDSEPESEIEAPNAKEAVVASLESEASQMEEVSPEAQALLGAAKDQIDPTKTHEEHPEFPTRVRLAYKNFGDPGASSSFNYLQKAAPDFEYKKDDKGRVLVKKPAEPKWSYLDDPNAFTFSDVGDIAYDLPATLFEGGATAIGGIAGAASPMPGGALAGAAGAGAASGALTEGVRQSLGKFFGVRDEYDPGMIGTSAGIGAVSPLLLGTGAGAKQVMKYAPKLNKMGIPVNFGNVDKIIAAQSGIPMQAARYGKDKVIPGISGALSGQSPDVLRNVRSNLKRIDNAKDAGLDEDLLTEVTTKAQEGIQELKFRKGEELGKALDEIEVTLDASEVEKPLYDLLEEAKVKADRVLAELPPEEAATKADVINYKHIKGLVEQYTSPTKTIKGSSALDALDNLNEITQIQKNINSAKKGPVDRRVIKAAKQAAGNIDKKIKDANPRIKQLKEEYAKLIEEDDVVQKMFKDDDATERSIKTLASGSQVAKGGKLRRISDELDLDLDKKALDYVSIKEFSKPASNPISSFKATSTSRTAPLATAGGLLGYGIGQGTGGEFSPYFGGAAGGLVGAFMAGPWALKQYMRLGKFGGAAIKPLQKAYQAGPAALPQYPQMVGKFWDKMGRQQPKPTLTPKKKEDRDGNRN